MKTVANTMVYTSIYLTKDGEDKLVLNTPYFESEVPSIIALKSYRLEEVEGLVIGAPLAVIQQMEDGLKKFEQATEDLDLTKLMAFLDKNGVSIRYVQSPKHPRAPKAENQITITKESSNESDSSESGDEG